MYYLKIKDFINGIWYKIAMYFRSRVKLFTRYNILNDMIPKNLVLRQRTALLDQLCLLTSAEPGIPENMLATYFVETAKDRKCTVGRIFQDLDEEIQEKLDKGITLDKQFAILQNALTI